MKKKIDLSEAKAFGERTVKQAKELGGKAAIQLKKVGETTIEQAKKLSENTAKHVQGVVHKKEKAPNIIKISELPGVTFWNSIKVYYYLMAIDGEICDKEEAKLNSIGQDLIESFEEHKDELISECKEQIGRIEDSDDYGGAVEAAIEDVLLDYSNVKMPEVAPRQLLWNLITIANSDDNYLGLEKKLIRFIARKFNIDKAVVEEMESSMLTVLNIEKEIAWLKTTDKSYTEIDTMITELKKREDAVAEGVYCLMAL